MCPISPPVDRLPPLDSAVLSDAQRAAAQRLIATPRGAVRGPFVPLMRSPELLDRTQALGEFLRYRCSLPVSVRELLILTVAAHWRQNYEWHIHAPLARDAGVDQHSIEQIGAGQRPAQLTAEQRAAHEFCRQLQQTQQVDQPTWQAAVRHFGEAGAVELCAMAGYYTLLAMVMNAAQTGLPGGVQPRF